MTLPSSGCNIQRVEKKDVRWDGLTSAKKTEDAWGAFKRFEEDRQAAVARFVQMRDSLVS